MDKGGVSGIITTVLLILLAIVVVGILWVVLVNFISGNYSEIGRGIDSVDIDIDSHKISGGNLEVRIKRNINGGDLTGVQVLLKDVDGNTDGIVISQIIKELESVTLIIPLSDFDYSKISSKLKSVSVFPVNNVDSLDIIGKLGDEKEFNKNSLNTEDGLIAYYKFEEATNTLVDSSVNGNDASCSGATCANFLLNGGHDNFGARDFDGFDDVFSRSGLGGWNEITISAWINPHIDSNEVIYANNGDYFFGILPTNRLRFQAGNGNWEGIEVRNINNEVTQNIWQHVSVTYNGVDGTTRFFINGIQSGNDKNGGTTIIGLSGNTMIGYGGWTDSYFDGLIDDLRVYNKELTPQEIYLLHKFN